jgi:predicted ATP-grasp superfamily ATP-dependent carboligase
MTPLGIVGASARAAAVSAVRAGFAPWAIDLFADRDLRRIAPVVRCLMDEYPNALPHYLEQMPPGPVMYTGGLENHPDVVRELAARRELWGNPADALDLTRNPFLLPIYLVPPRVSYLAVVPGGDPCPQTGRWLRKRFRSAGGMGIRFAEPGETAPTSHYFQRFADGVPMSMLFHNSSRDGLTYLGWTEQLVGEPWLHAEPFAYCGNIGPADLPDEVHNGLLAFARQVAEESGLRGVWGLDFIFDYETAFPVEINPRYTASAEVIELASRSSVLAEHAREFSTVAPDPHRGSREQVVGKAIYYAPHAITFPAGPWDDELARPFDPWRVPEYADIPDAGIVIEAGHPVLTFFAVGDTPAGVRTTLQSRAAELDSLFAEYTP